MENFKGKSIVAFIDLLGFSNEIIGKWNDPEEKTNPLSRLMSIRKLIELEFSEEAGQGFYDDKGDPIFEHHTPVKVLSVSDSFTIIMPFEDDDNLLQKMGKLFMVCGAIHSLWKYCIDQGFTIRGGIDTGDIFFSDVDIIGPTFINAYLIESKIAKTSRIILSNKIKELIREYIENGNSEFKGFLELWFDLEKDGHLSINPIIAYESDQAQIKDAIKKIRDIRDKAGITLSNKFTPVLNRLEGNQLTTDNISKFNNSNFVFK